MGAVLFHADRRTNGRTDMTKLIVAISNFANAPETSEVCHEVLVKGISSTHTRREERCGLSHCSVHR